MQAANLPDETWTGRIAAAHVLPTTDPVAAAVYAIQDRLFFRPTAPHRTDWYLNADHATRDASRIAHAEGLGQVYAQPTPEFTRIAVLADQGDRAVILLPHARCAFWSRPIIVHELAHLAVGTDRGHDPAWCREFVRLIRDWVDVAAGDRLEWEFHRSGLFNTPPQDSRPNVADGRIAG